MSCSDHIRGEDQTLDSYMEVLRLRAEAFKAWVLESVEKDARGDESDWDDAYREWLEKVDQGVGFGPYSFLDHVRENQ